MLVDSAFPLNYFKRVVSAAVHIWRDSRLPVLARMLFLCGVVYVFAPGDWFPDSTSIGYVDDIGIVSLLAYVLRRIIPAVIFQDARRGAASTACGILCLNLVAPLHLGYGPTMLNTAVANVSAIKDTYAGFKEAQEANNIRVQFLAVSPQAQSLRKVAPYQFALPDFCAIMPAANPYSSKGTCTRLACSLAHVSLKPARTLLWWRGGQKQFYSSAYELSDSLTYFCKAAVPSWNNKGGIVFTSSDARAQTVSTC